MESRRPPEEADGARRRAPSRARLFLALDPIDSARAALASWRDAVLAGQAGLRLVPAQSLHVTLVFLGHRPEAEIEPIGESLDAVEGLSAPVLWPVGIEALPRRRPRLLALDLDDPEKRAGAVQAAASGALEARKLHAPERRLFWPHLTLARLRGRRGREAGLDWPPPAGRPEGPLRFEHVTLYRSHLAPGGARYEPLVRQRLRA
ncbi:MAG TPA: RNA 2',3'-cyclic phosphodiesterase [Thermoleophilaceae bacterium]|nr:RNA 2',3'-cyclic phosphodiesterase [Thermoleophilaceae bacterium]